MYTNKTISNLFLESLNNCYGSKKNFEKQLIYKAYQIGNKGKLYFKIDRYLNFKLSEFENNEDLTLLICNLDNYDIYNFIEDLDYPKLSNAYLEAKKLIQP